jgi:acyl-CoA dehydrogenase
VDFDFSDDQKALKDHARRFLEKNSPRETVRAVLDGELGYDATLWGAVGDMGLPATAIPQQYGGLGLGYLELCVIAEELGRSLAPVPVSSSIYLAAELLLVGGSEAQKQAWLPKLASGEAVGTFALAEAVGLLAPEQINATATKGRIDGVKLPVPDGMIADVAIVGVRPCGQGPVSLYLIELAQPGVARDHVATIDPTRGHARLTFTNAAAEPLGAGGDAWPVIETSVVRLRADRRRGSGLGDGARLCAGAARLRAADRIIPSDQTHAGGYVRVRRAGPIQRLLCGLGALHQCT